MTLNIRWIYVWCWNATSIFIERRGKSFIRRHPSIFSKGVDGGRLRDGVGAGTIIGWSQIGFFCQKCSIYLSKLLQVFVKIITPMCQRSFTCGRLRDGAGAGTTMG